MLSAQAYLEIVKSRGERRLELRRVYHNLRNPDLFLTAYSNLYANQGALTPGTDPNDSIDGMSMRRIERLITSLEDGSFRWKPARRVYIKKANGSLRPLSIPNWTDKLVQEALRLILNAYYEPRFSVHSHGFRTGHGCHTALQKILSQWRGTRWFIEGDIKGCFDAIDHEALLGIIGKDIKDERFLKLLREMLKAGYLEDWQYHRTFSGTPQGGIISPLLSNIYLNELDNFVEQELLPKYNRGKRRRSNPEYSRLNTRTVRAKKKGNLREAERLRKRKGTIPYGDPFDPDYRRLRYVRYADDFILGFEGPKVEAEEIREELRRFLSGIKLTLSEEKTLITHASNENARFLGYELTIAWDNSQKTNGKRSINGLPMLRVPRKVRQQWIRKYQRREVTVHNPKLLADEDYDIVLNYNVALQGLVNYYTLAVNVSTLNQVKHVMRESLVKTIAHKHKRRHTWVYRKYGAISPDGIVCIEVKVERDGKPPLIARFGAKPIRYNKFAAIEDVTPNLVTRRSQLITRLLAEKCELCGKDGEIEVHHVKGIRGLIKKYKGRGKDMPWWVQRMAEMYRNTLIVCHDCHVKIHNGTYDGAKLGARK